MKEGVDAGSGRPSSRAEVITGPGDARECPDNAHVRILSGSVVLTVQGRGYRVPGASHRVRARGEIRYQGAPVGDASTAIARTCDVMIHSSPTWNSRCRPRPTQPIFRQLPPKVDPLRQARVRAGKNWPPWTNTSRACGLRMVIR